MSESAVATSSGPSLEQILWGAIERWSGEAPALADREEFASRIFDAWGGTLPSEDFLTHFFGEDGAGLKAADMAEAVVRASRDRMHVYEFDLNKLEYVVIEEEDKVVVVSQAGQFQFSVDDQVSAVLQSGVLAGSTNPIGSGGKFDRTKNDGVTPRAYYVKANGEMVAVDVAAVARAITLAREIKQVEVPAVDKAGKRMAAFGPVRRQVTSEREARILRQDERMRQQMTPSLLAGVGGLRGERGGQRDGGLSAPPPMGAEPTVILLMPDGTLARPAIGSGTRWREMVSDWTARAAFISVGATLAPVLVASPEQRFVIEGSKVVAVFSGGARSTTSTAAPGAAGLLAEARSTGISAARGQFAEVRVLGDDELAQAVANGARLVSGLQAGVSAAGGARTGFWLQPEAVFAPSERDRELVAGGVQGRSLNDELNQLLAQTNGQPGTGQLGSVTGDPWADWALQTGGKVNPGELLLASRTRPKLAAALAQASAGGAPPLLPAAIAAAGGVVLPGTRLIAFRAPDGTLVTSAAPSAVRLAALGRAGAWTSSSGAGEPGAGPRFEGASSSSGGKRGALALRSGALPATTLAALSMALQKSASAGGYKLPVVRLESAVDAIEAGERMSADLGPGAPARTSVRLVQAPLLTGEGQLSRLVLSMPFPNSGEVHVGTDLAEALSHYLSAPAVPAAGGGFGRAGGALVGAGAGVAGGGVLAALAGSGAGAQALGADGQPMLVVEGGGDFSPLHKLATDQAQQALLDLRQPGVPELLQGRVRIGGLPSLLQTALEQSGEWTPGPGAPVPGGVRSFAFSGPFDLPELVAAGQPAVAAGAPAAQQRPLGQGEDEIVIPLPLWAQMGRGRISSTADLLAAAGARPGYAPPLGVYRLVSPGPRADFAPEGSPNSTMLAGPTALSFELQGTGPMAAPQARSLGGRFALGNVPVLVEGAEGAEGARPRGRLGAPLEPGQLRSSAAPFAAGESGFSGALGSPGRSSLPSLGGAPSGSLVGGRPAIPQVPDVNLPPLGGLSQSAPSAGGGVPPRPMAGALQSALRLSSDLDARSTPSLPGMNLPAGSFAGGAAASGGAAGAGGFSGGALVQGSPGSTSSSSFGSDAAAVRRQADDSSASLARSTASGLPAGAITGAYRTEDGYTPWIYSAHTPTESGTLNLGGVDLHSGLSRPTYPSLPTSLRFRYASAPLWWSAAGRAGQEPDAESEGSAATRSLRSGLKAATAAASLWRSIFVSPSRGGYGGAGTENGALDRSWDRSADQLSASSGHLGTLALGAGAGAAAGGAAGAALAGGRGPETVYVAMDSQGRAGTTSAAAFPGKNLPGSSLSMSIVAAIPPSPPSVESMGSGAGGVTVEPRARGKHHKPEGHHAEEGGSSQSKIEGSVDAVAQRIFHRIRYRLLMDKERFNG